MGVRLWTSQVSTPTLTLPLHGGGEISAQGLLGLNLKTAVPSADYSD
jgi:hypothetical protein